jgi:hypothetical protein
MKPLSDARIGDLGPGDFVKVECICGHSELIPHSGLQEGLRLPPPMPVLDLRKPRQSEILNQDPSRILHGFAANLVRMRRLLFPGQSPGSAATLIFEIRRQAGGWAVKLGDNTYGEYLDKEQARLDAIDAATDARQAGHAVEVWDRSTNARVF